jgi:hypothetical protein
VPAQSDLPNRANASSMHCPAGIPRHGWRSWLAIGAAYLLVVQVLVTGVSMGISAAPMSLDVSGLTICGDSVSDHSPDGSGQKPDKTHLPSCCTLGCSMFGPSIAPPPALVSFSGMEMYGREIAARFRHDRVDARVQQTPHKPRGPPLLA